MAMKRSQVAAIVLSAALGAAAGLSQVQVRAASSESQVPLDCEPGEPTPASVYEFGSYERTSKIPVTNSSPEAAIRAWVSEAYPQMGSLTFEKANADNADLRYSAAREGKRRVTVWPIQLPSGQWEIGAMAACNNELASPKAVGE